MRFKKWLPFSQGLNKCWFRSDLDPRFLQCIVSTRPGFYLCFLMDLSGSVVPDSEFPPVDSLSHAKSLFK